MKKIIHYILLFVFCAQCVSAQKENNVWAFATRCGLDFNSGDPVILLTNINTLEGSAAISDINTGKLLFYTDGNRVYTRNHSVMPNGILLSTDIVGRTTSTTQATAIASVPGKYGQYYVFSLESGPSIHSRLFYSIVDIRLNNGLGDIVSGQKAVLLDSALTEKMAVVKGNNCDIWLMTRSLIANEYKAFHITNTGINTTPVISVIGNWLPLLSYGIGEIMFSNDGRKMVAGCSQAASMEIYDFDANTGILSNDIYIFAQAYGMAFSPDDSKLYISLGIRSQPDIYQMDLTVPTFTGINNSRLLVASLPPGSFPVSSPGLWNLKLASNGKIYFGAGQNMSVINQPNLAGTACDPAYNIITFPSGMSQYLGMPNPSAALPFRSAFTRVCGRDSVILQALASGINYVWDDQVSGDVRTITQSGYYAVTYQVGCEAYIDSFYVQLNTVFPEITNSPACANTPEGMLGMYNNPGDTAVYTYTWMDSSGQVLRTASGNAGDTLTGLFPGLYKVTVTNQSGCDSTFLLRVPTLPIIPATFLADTVACTGVPLHFTNTSGATKWSWSFGDGSGISDEYSPVHVYNNEGVYHAALYTVADNGCTDTGMQIIHVYSLNLTLTASDSIMSRNKSVTLITQGNDHYTITAWMPSPLFVDQTAKEQVISVDSNTSIIVTAVSEKGCLDTATLVLLMNPDLFLPSSFTPNGDGRNDFFRVMLSMGIQPVNISLSIFDRWGKEVWRGEGATTYTGWDGLVNGHPAEIGTYYYILQAKMANGEDVMQKGNVILIR